jgi:CheY-like chemotaxis protein
MAAPSNHVAVVVDDDDQILMHAAEILEVAGYVIYTALSAQEGLEVVHAKADEVTLLFTDVHMPNGMNGFALAREVAKRWPQIEILVASGDCSPKDGDLPEGAIFVAKPFSAEVVHDRLKQMLPDDKKPEPLKT